MPALLFCSACSDTCLSPGIAWHHRTGHLHQCFTGNTTQPNPLALADKTSVTLMPS